MPLRKDPEIDRLKRLLNVEKALDKVGVVAMRMKKRADMLLVCKTITQQLQKLGVQEIRNVQTAIFYKERGSYMNYEYYAKHNKSFITDTLYNNHKIARDFAAKMLKGKGEAMVKHIKGEKVKQWLAYQKTTNVFIDHFLKTASSLSYYWFSLGPVALGISTYEPLRKDDIELFKKFLRVFQLAYTRYLDIEKAEAQAREAQIEAALERVRSRSIGMQKSEELKEVIRVVLKQFVHLNINVEHAGFYIDYKVHDDMHIWLADPNIEPFYAIIPYFDTPTWNSFLEAKEKGITLHTDLLDFKTKNKFYKSLFELFTVPEEAKEFYLQCKGLAVSTVLLDNVGLYIENFSAIPYTDEENAILMRFGKVFQQTYTRFLDLQKAEAQAREAQIQLALERVRARTMAMQKSDELSEAVYILFQQFKELGENPDQATIGIINEKDHVIEYWVTMYGNQMNRVFKFSIDEPNVTNRIYKAWKENKSSFAIDLSGKELREFSRYRESMGGAKYNPAEQRRIINVAFFSKGLLNVQSNEERSEESIQLLERFAAVFEQTYTRFLDLQKAEAQAREAQIEVALERVRARAMAMQNSEELKELIGTVFIELTKLDLVLTRCLIMIYDPKTNDSTWWMANSEAPTDPIGLNVQNHEHIPYLAYIKAWQEKQIKWTYPLEGEIKKQWDNFLFVETGLSHLPDFVIAGMKAPDKVYLNASFNSFGNLTLATLEPLSDEHFDIMLRFAKVFDLTYTRFNDLKQAEAQTREAQIEAALEKVRSRTLAMQRSDELAETASELFRQMIGLGIEPNRLYIGIIHEENNEADFWITDEDGGKLSAAYTANLNDNDTFKKMYTGWKTQQQHSVIDMQGKELKEYFQYLQSIHVPFKGGLEQKRRVQHLAYFSKGFIGLASPEEQPVETFSILDRFAYVFNLTFTRFNDLKVAEAHAIQAEKDLIEIMSAKKKAEDALAELQLTQKQLVQAEKMASLGELTAGIAHEIQNPLNFVNNFSEVSNELIAEMTEELDKGDIEEAKAIAHDIQENLEKINHHGKRADAIVKGMLQHSRTSSGQKELTDINALCDEYLRLAYHGLRAKDKTFNAKFETDFDNTIGKMNIVPQDIGRVILNLINNAFFAVTEKKKNATENFEPTVTITTKKFANNISVSVKDNGSGIPEAIREKIFQPFFTTKPTGQGTGLGLSLSYDIIKAHAGEIKVETKEGEGTEFIFVLPA